MPNYVERFGKILSQQQANLYNRLPQKSIENKIPYEIDYKKSPNY